MTRRGRRPLPLIAAVASMLVAGWLPSSFASSGPRAAGTAAGWSGAHPSAPGDQLWASVYNGPEGGDDRATAIGASPGGTKVFVTGYNFDTVAYDSATGTQLWASQYQGTGNAGDATALGVSPGGATVFVTGYSNGVNTGTDYATVAYDADTGDQLWAARFTGPGRNGDEPFALGVSPGGSKVFVTGVGSGGGFTTNYVTIAYDAGTGRRLWVQRYRGTGQETQQATGLAVSPGGSKVFVTGESSGSPYQYDYATVAYDASTGKQLWVSRFNAAPGSDDSAGKLQVNPDGSTLFVTGFSNGGSAQYDYVTIAYDTATGRQRWVSRYGGPARGDDYPSALQVTPDGSTLFVTGSSTASNGEFDYATVAYDAASGTQLGAVRYNGPANGYDYAYGLGMSPDGSQVFVTGFSEEPGGVHAAATVDYSASTGDRLWVRRYDGPGDIGAAAFELAVSPGGSRLYVAGEAGVFGTGTDDFATVAYSIT